MSPENWMEFLTSKKAEEVQFFDLNDISDIAEKAIVATALNNRHLSKLSEDLMRWAKSKGEQLLIVDGLSSCEWIIHDFGEVMVHLFLPETRVHFDLEGFWEEMLEKRTF